MANGGKLKLHWQIVIGIVLGAALGLLVKKAVPGLEPHWLSLVTPVGDIFIRLLKMIIIPLVAASIVTGVAGIGDMRHLGRLGGRTFAYYLTTTFLAVVVGLIMVNLLNPGKGIPLADEGVDNLREPPTMGEMLSDIVPRNPVRAMADDQVLSVIFFSLLLGGAITAVGDKARTLHLFFEGLNDVMMRITDWIMRLAPVGVFALMATMVGRLGPEMFKSLGVYMGAVLSGLGIHAFVTLPLLLFFFGKYSPARLFRDMFSALGTAFSTASSAATLPLTLKCIEKNAGIPPKTASFVLPLGATMNMDGTALYEAVAAIFIANAYGVTLTFAQQVTIAVTATLASIGAAAVPSAGLVMMVLVLKAVNLPLEGIALIAGVDRILDMCRTTINVWGDSCGTVVVSRMIDKE